MILHYTCRGLDITAVFIAELVGEGVFRALPHIVPACNPLVPARHKYKIGVTLNCVIPLLLKIHTVKPMAAWADFEQAASLKFINNHFAPLYPGMKILIKGKSK